VSEKINKNDINISAIQSESWLKEAELNKFKSELAHTIESSDLATKKISYNLELLKR